MKITGHDRVAAMFSAAWKSPSLAAPSPKYAATTLGGMPGSCILWILSAYAAPEAWADPAVSPLLAAHSGLPPLLIQAGSSELLAPDAGLLAASASAAGTDVTYTRWPGMWHDFVLQPGLLAAADSALTQAAWFVGTVSSAR